MWGLGSVAILYYPLAGEEVPLPPSGAILITDGTNLLITDNTSLLMAGS